MAHYKIRYWIEAAERDREAATAWLRRHDEPRSMTQKWRREVTRTTLRSIRRFPSPLGGWIKTGIRESLN